MIDSKTADDIRALFDWRRPTAAALPVAHREATPVANDDLALALNLLSCNRRDREQFQRGRDAALGA